MKPDETPQAATKLRDPRTLKLLDPACGSMHFGLYAFDLFAEIYREAWAWEQQHGPGSLDVSTQPQAALKPLSQTYEDEAAFLRDVPRLIIEHNIYGVDIDPRAAQIASLALWLRAQRAWHDAGVKAKDRPPIGRGHVVAAIAPPAERELRQQFAANLDQRDAELFEKTLQLLKGLPELGVLLQVERELPHLIRQVYVGKGTGLFAEQEQANWQQAEARLRTALTEFAQAAKSTYQGRLFAQDALQGLRLIDLCREVFDVVVMNPPFGLPAASSKDYLVDRYPATWKDLYAAMADRSLGLLSKDSILGAITPSTWQHTREMRDFRQRLYKLEGPALFVELGGGVMDDAAVEAALWTTESQSRGRGMWSLDLLKQPEHIRPDSILPTSPGWTRHEIVEFKNIADTPYCHHLRKEYLGFWNKPHRFGQATKIAAGNTTFDDFRFLRLWFEISTQDSKGWIPYRAGGDFQPFYAATRLRINWQSEGASARASGIAKHKTDAQVMQSSEHWGRAGLSYPRVGTLGLGIRIAPAGEIFSSGSVSIFPENDSDILLALGLLNSNLALYLYEAHGRNRMTETIAIKDLPISLGLLEDARDDIEVATIKAVGIVRQYEGFDETNPNFKAPLPEWKLGSLCDYSAQAYKEVCSAAFEISDSVATAMGVDRSQLPDPDATNWRSSISPEEEARRIVSYAVGASFERWNGEYLESAQSVLTDDDLFQAFPAVPRCVNRVAYGTEILCDDPSSKSDLLERIRLFFATTWSGNKISTEQDICNLLEVADLRDYIRKPNAFFSDHLRRYSAHRRTAPIYWPISTRSGGYTLWIYYPRLTSQTLFLAINNFIGPKLKEVSAEGARLSNQGAGRKRDEEKQFEILQAFELELIELRDTLLKLAPSYKPNHDDGVQISAAPLWPLFRHKPWQKVLKETWAKLEKGDYDWAHLAMNYWTDRVREKCKTDKSLAIAHGLEDLYVEPEAKPKKARGKSK